MKKKVPELEILACNKVGDGKSPNLFFVSVGGVIQTVTRDFSLVYREWRSLPRAVETMLEDRRWGVICDTSPQEENSSKLETWDNSTEFLRMYHQPC